MPARPAAGIVLTLLALAVAPAAAFVDPGQVAPDFTKTVLGGSPWPTASLSQFAGRVVVLHILGWD